MKTIILNGSPRQDWNTAQLLKSARKGAESIGAEVEYYDLYDLKYTGCRSCLACKRKGIGEPCKCYYGDELEPIIDRIYKADRLILGSPIYFGEPTGQLRAALERIFFPALSYNTFSSTFHGSLTVDVFLTMNCPQEVYEKAYSAKMEEYFGPFHLLNTKARIVPIWDTVQVSDYAKYDMDGINGAAKQARHDAELPAALELAFKVGAGTADT